jgi:hypothetical protein
VPPQTRGIPAGINNMKKKSKNEKNYIIFNKDIYFKKVTKDFFKK